MEVTLALLNLTYQHSAKDLTVILGDYLLQLPGGEDWRNKRNPIGMKANRIVDPALVWTDELNSTHSEKLIQLIF